MSEISHTKKQLGFANKQLQNKGRIGGGQQKENSSLSTNAGDFSNEDMQRSIKMVETIEVQKKQLEYENEELR